MASEFKIPNLGDNVDSGEVLSILVQEGDSVSVDAPLFELETGKATIEVPSDIAGKITKIMVKEGDSVSPGQVAVMIESDETAKKEAGEPKKAAAEEKKAEEPKQEPTKPADDKPKETKENAPERPASSPSAASNTERIPVAAAPSVRKFAREIGVNISDVPGSGPNERITIDDVKRHAKELLTQGGAGRRIPDASFAVPPLPDFAKWGEVDRQSMNNVRKMTAQHMALCWGTIPHVTQQDKADITKLEEARKRFAKRAEDAGGKLTLTAILIKVIASALKVYPQFNASLDLASEEIVFKKYINIGVAVDTPKGLLVPVVKNVDQRGIIDLSVELTAIAEKARNGKITPADMQGGTFTLSNLGGIGGSHFTPIVNHPEVGILGVGRGAYEPVFIDGEFEPRLMLPLSLSYDHRVIDGADGARFVRWVAEALQEPLLVALEG